MEARVHSAIRPRGTPDDPRHPPTDLITDDAVNLLPLSLVVEGDGSVPTLGSEAAEGMIGQEAFAGPFSLPWSLRGWGQVGRRGCHHHPLLCPPGSPDNQTDCLACTCTTAADRTPQSMAGGGHSGAWFRVRVCPASGLGWRQALGMKGPLGRDLEVRVSQGGRGPWGGTLMGWHQFAQRGGMAALVSIRGLSGTLH